MVTASNSQPGSRPTVVLVHGAFADASGWHKVIPLLEARGLGVLAVQTPLTSLDDDVATARRAIEGQPAPVVLVGHSYGGAVITAAAAGSARVKALVYVAAFAPEAGESLGSLLESKAASDIGPSLVPDAGGFLTIDRARFHDVFCKDIPAADARVMAATQKPISGPIFTTPCPSTAWKTIPSWYLVATEDRAINPELQRFMAKRIGAKTTEVKASHVPFLSRPDEVAVLIEQAAIEVAKVPALRS